MMGDLLIPESSPVALRPTAKPLRACENVRTHAHNYDHTTVVTRGRVRVAAAYAEDAAPFQTEEYHAGEHFVVRAGIWHTVTALEDSTEWICIFSHRDFGGVLVEHYTGNRDAAE